MLRDAMTFFPGMEQTDTHMLQQILNEAADFDFDQVLPSDVAASLNKPRLDALDFARLLSPAAEAFIEEMAVKAQHVTQAHFGNNIQLFTPLYLGNYCENHCTYCGFSCKNKIKRGKLSVAEMTREFEAIAASGLEDILLLTGESRHFTDVAYIGEAVRLAQHYFQQVGLEIYPLDTAEYQFLHECGADYVCVYQETYQPDVYEKIHLTGHKRSFPYRFNAQTRALAGGMRAVSFGALLGIGDFRQDAFATGRHAACVQQQFPEAEIALSCPRLRPYIHEKETAKNLVKEKQLLQVMLAYRLYLPFAGITISTRERGGFRDHVVGMCATKMSAGVKVSVGGHDAEAKGDEQFEISDERDVDQIAAMLQQNALQPVYNDYIYL